MDTFNDETVFEKEQCINILKEVCEECLAQQQYSHAKVGQWISEICEKKQQAARAAGQAVQVCCHMRHHAKKRGRPAHSLLVLLGLFKRRFGHVPL
mmetsp:Transcript_11866/g.30793  ORF Transcript_11866/g.30793 Transcript_11866/m.30793 type:complete len:96 (+) Transcript_11866:46-333(+)